jgi:phytoene dehydrogenase-like protein
LRELGGEIETSRPVTALRDGRFTLAPRLRRSSNPSARAGRGGTPSARSSSSLGKACSTRRSRRPASTSVWAYCHVPGDSTVDVRDRIDAQIERFAPGFRERIVAAAAHGPRDLERSNANLVGGDISAGASHLTRLLRPLRHATPVPWLHVCSAATFPGAAVHGMGGNNAARAALRRRRDPSSEG